MDRKKVIKGLEICKNIHGRCSECPYDDNKLEFTNCTSALCGDAIALLIEQEAVEPKVEKAILDYQSWHYICGDCGGQIDIQDNYCRHCGRVVAHLSNKI